ncbi:MAG: D-alanyl-D-alanine carboxypeptidase [Proteobacteria bacterium]|nr:D-alanyl-D-alanine carboxypeptidase [Pseudomonadota bacterium]
MRSKFLSTLILAVTFNIAAANISAAQSPGSQHPPRHDNRPHQTALVVESGTRDILFEKDPDQQVYPASLTKLMTLYLTFEAVEKSQLKLNQCLSVSDLAASQPHTSLNLKTGQTITVEEAISALTVQSANDVAVVLAEAIGGTQEHFVEMMNAKAKELGMSRTHFVNPNGLPDPLQVTTARDIVTLAEAHFCNFPQYSKYFEKQSFVFNGHIYKNHSRLPGRVPEIDFAKTGFIDASGFNMAASAHRGDERLFVVVFGGPSASARDKKIMTLLNSGFVKVTPATPPKTSRPHRHKSL